MCNEVQKDIERFCLVCLLFVLFFKKGVTWVLSVWKKRGEKGVGGLVVWNAGKEKGCFYQVK